ncbi:LamG-like jellyroll fold domain-containing protein [Catenovulum maritimum]|uniref:PA14 domain-containing protein n=1 Tax=Catenovulum maritimum TaxID=1513271 RepID=A0A0J8GNF0_9ALTE|nr:LamG-like jellyroll fold domain-containing protein [Catenovulum maritimum]KMT64332.1 hypothetical protein XM47_15175 [Catenovulum maritimum]
MLKLNLKACLVLLLITVSYIARAADSIPDNSVTLGLKQSIKTTNLPQGTKDATIEFWFKTASANSGLMQVIFTPALNNPQPNISAWLENGILKISNFPGASALMSSTKTLNDNQWHHFALTAESQTDNNLVFKWFLDGDKQASYKLKDGATKGYFSSAVVKLLSAEFYAGLQAEYYRSQWIEYCHYTACSYTGYEHFKTLLGRQLDQNIGNFYGHGAPRSSGFTVPNDQFAIKWQGYLLAPETGEYALSTVSDDGLKLWIDDNLVIDKWQDGGHEASHTLTTTANSLHKIKMDYYEKSGGSYVRLRWDPPHTNIFDIPAGHFYWQDPTDITASFAEPRLWNSVRTEQEIKQAYNLPLDGHEQGLNNYTRFTAFADLNEQHRYFWSRTGQNSQVSVISNAKAKDLISATIELPVVNAATGQHALSLDGTQAQTLSAKAAGYGDLLSNKSYTIEFWARNGNRRASHNSSSFNPAVAVVGADARASYAFGFSNEKIFCANQRAGGGIVNANAEELPTPWVHIACSYDLSTGAMNVYRNGDLVGSNTGISAVIATSDLLIGTDGFNNHYKGELDELRIWHSVRTQAEIKANMRQRITQQPTNLVLYQTFDNPSIGDSETQYNFKDVFNANTLLGQADTLSRQQLTYGVKLDNLDKDGAIPVNGEQALRFDSPSQSASINLTAEQLTSIESAFTFSAWVNTTSAAKSEQFIAGNDTWLLTRSVNNQLNLYQVGNATAVITSSKFLTNANWQQFAVVYSNNKLSLYLNGVIEGTADVVLAKASTGLELAKTSQSNISLSPFNGSYDQLQLWQSALSAEQLIKLFKLDLQGGEPGLIAKQSFNKAQVMPTGSLLFSAMTLTDLAASNIVDGLAFSKTDLEQAYYFDGVDDSLTTGLVELDLTDGISVDFWSRLAALNQDSVIFKQASDTSSFTLGVTSSNQFYCDMAGFKVTTAAESLDLLWHHWACVLELDKQDNLQLAIYKDGVKLASETSSTSISYKQNLAVVLGHHDTAFFHGWLDELHIWSRTLVASDLNRLQKSSPAANSEKLTAYWHFNDVFAGIYTDAISGVNAISAANSAPQTSAGIELSDTALTLGGQAPTGELKYGLWQGQAIISAVNESHFEVTADAAAKPTATSTTFALPFLIHGNASATHLLSEATLMQTKSTASEAIKRVIITDQTMLANYDGIIRRNGKLTGIRLSALPFVLNYDATSKKVNTQQMMQGSIGEGGAVSIVIEYAKDHPINPYRHLYHPDLDQGFVITRNIQFSFDAYSAEQKANNTKLGVSELSGTYTEKVTGLHKQTKDGSLAPIISTGQFNMQLVSPVTELNK